MSANSLRGLRGPGGLPRAGPGAGNCVEVTEPDADALISVADDEESSVCAVDDDSGGYHRGHVLASSESSGT